MLQQAPYLGIDLLFLSLIELSLRYGLDLVSTSYCTDDLWIIRCLTLRDVFDLLVLDCNILCSHGALISFAFITFFPICSLHTCISLRQRTFPSASFVHSDAYRTFQSMYIHLHCFTRPHALFSFAFPLCKLTSKKAGHNRHEYSLLVHAFTQ